VKRFYTDVTLGPDQGILLDGRPVRTPARVLLTLPTRALAEAIADEWRAQVDTINPRTMPMTGLANAAIDRVAPDPAGFAAGLARYAETDLLAYRADDQPELAARQEAVWGPILSWAQARYDSSFVLASGIMPVQQHPDTIARLSAAITVQPVFALAALQPLVTIAGSLIIALALCEGHMAADAAFDAAHLDELWQEELWGADDLAIQARDVRRTDFMAAARFLALL
jgi:chaperone required for assembly of F1-ATPase